MLGLITELKATTTLCILDTLRQRGLSAEDAADIAGIDADRMRDLIERRAVKDFGVDELEEILEALDAPTPRP